MRLLVLCYFSLFISSKVGACTFSVTASRNCNVLDYYFCSGLTRYKKLHTCSDAQGGCYPSSNLVVETCVSPADTYGVWSCTGVSTRSRVNVLRTPTCSPGGCGVSSSTVTETQNCGAGNYCQGGNCYSYTYSWNVGSWGSCSAVCGGIQTRSVSCQRNDGVIVADSFCSGVKPATSQSCGASSCNSFHWDAGSWGSCSVSCGGGIQSRSVGCYDSSNSLVSDSYCSGSKPSTSQSCNTQACTGNCVSHPHWEYKCYGGSSIWWYDSCGIRESVKESCPDGCQEGYIQCDYVAAYTKSHEQFWACQSCGGWAPDPGISDCINPDVDSTYNCGSGYTAIGVGYGHANYPQISGITEGPDGECSSNPPEPGINYISYKWLCRSNY
ncbi:thrombospondin type-1 domain-containing protein [Candidatus Woesearchaeota archaeon]|nr:thrombospondin type-1 domain-containing protein [Candidatus Woesearchaeota archaeon]USN44205.1 MAG: thrombospondin type-1 domain-containing protein [Candidatus Woesearchaeota archaeon]